MIPHVRVFTSQVNLTSEKEAWVLIKINENIIDLDRALLKLVLMVT